MPGPDSVHGNGAASTGGPPSLSIGGVAVSYSLISLVTLTVQNSALTILLHYSRTSPSAKPYSAAAAVLLNEILKGAISLSIALNNVESHNGGHARYTSEHAAPLLSASGRKASMSSRKRENSLALGQEEAGWTMPTASDSPRKRMGGALTARPRPRAWWLTPSQWRYRVRTLSAAILSPDCWKLAVPACCYVLQNNLQFVAASNLDVATFQVSYQMKILTTAFFSVTMLNKRLSTMKWLCLLALAVGVAIVQLQGAQTSGKTSSSGHPDMDRFTGFCAVIMACITSGFAGCYFEKVLKGSTADLWVRNVQLTLFSLPPALLPALFPDLASSLFSFSSPSTALRIPDADAPTWLFGNFGGWAIAVVSCQVFGGLVTALVIRYSDNIAKGFATSLSIIISFLAGVLLFSFPVTLPFVIGCSIVLAATWFYNQPDRDFAAHRFRLSSAYTLLSGGRGMGSNRAEGASHTIEISSASPEMNGGATHKRFAPSSIGSDGSGTDPIYPFAEYPTKPGVQPPRFINVSPFTTPVLKSSGSMLEEAVSPRSPVPPYIEGQPFGPPMKQS